MYIDIYRYIKIYIDIYRYTVYRYICYVKSNATGMAILNIVYCLLSRQRAGYQGPGCGQESIQLATDMAAPQQGIWTLSQVKRGIKQAIRVKVKKGGGK